MEEHREKKLRELRQRVQSGEYVVDPTAVADAVVHRIWGFELEPAPAPVPLALARRRIRKRVRGSAVTGGADRRTEALAGMQS